jgi:hypothetical protein
MPSRQVRRGAKADAGGVGEIRCDENPSEHRRAFRVGHSRSGQCKMPSSRRAPDLERPQPPLREFSSATAKSSSRLQGISGDHRRALFYRALASGVGR